MALRDEQIRECFREAGAFLERRRPRAEIRDKLDYRADIVGSDLVIVAVRPAFQEPTRKTDEHIAKLKWVGTRRVWRLFWMRADLKWHSYEPMPEAATVAAGLEEVERDPYGCFFG